MGRFTGILGLLTMLTLAYIFSTNRRAIRGKTVAWGLGLQFAFAVFVLRMDTGRRIFQYAGDAVNKLLSYAFVGSQFVFGELGKRAPILVSISPSRFCLPSSSLPRSSPFSTTTESCNSSSSRPRG